MRSAVISRCCSCKRGRREWGLLVALSTIILSNVIHTSLPPPCCNSSFLFHFQSSILPFKCLNFFHFFWTFRLILFSFRLPSHTFLIYPQGNSAAITVSFGNCKQDHQWWRYHRRLLDYQSPYFQLIIVSWGSSNGWGSRKTSENSWEHRKTVGKHRKTAENIGKHLKSSDIILTTTEDPS